MTSTHGPRVLLYSHDTYGLGHLRRSLLISERLAAVVDRASVLIVTGSPRARSFPLAEGCDTLKLPAIIKQPDGRYLPRTLRMPLEDLCGIRSRIICAAFESFEPDLILVDHAPAGVHGELRPMFAAIASNGRKPAMVLGLRDVIDHAPKVREEWERLGIPELLSDLYDEILVYGDPALPTTAEELELERLHPGRVRHVGFVARAPQPSMQQATFGPRPYVLVTTGGGGDGREVLDAYAAYLESLGGPAPFRSVVVTGPLLSGARSREVRARFSTTGSAVELVAFTDQMEPLLAHASAIISMAGYNTAAEVLASRVPALFIPRCSPRAEQTIRASRLARLSGIDWCSAADATPERIGRFLEVALASGPLPPPRCDLGGLDRTAEILRLLLERSTKEDATRARTAG